MRQNHYSRRTEKTYWYWILFYIRYHGKRHPLELSERDVTAFLSFLATKRNVAANTQRIALNAIVFLYRRVVERPLGELPGIKLSTRPRRLPSGFSHVDAVNAIIARQTITEDRTRSTASGKILPVMPSDFAGFTKTDFRVAFLRQLQVNAGGGQIGKMASAIQSEIFIGFVTELVELALAVRIGPAGGGDAHYVVTAFHAIFTFQAMGYYVELQSTHGSENHVIVFQGEEHLYGALLR